MGSQTEAIHSGFPAQQARLVAQTANSTGQAATGTTQADALVLTANITNFTTVGSGTGALLPSAGGLAMYAVMNNGISALLVYPAVGESLNGAAVNASVSVPAGKSATFIPHSNMWIANISA